MLRSLRTFLELIRFSHTIFALPFALTNAALAWRESGRRPPIEGAIAPHMVGNQILRRGVFLDSDRDLQFPLDPLVPHHSSSSMRESASCQVSHLKAGSFRSFRSFVRSQMRDKMGWHWNGDRRIIANVEMTKEEPAMEGDWGEWEQSLEYFHRFRQLSRRFVDYLLRLDPQTAKEDWQCQCHHSFAVFLAQYPTPDDRRQIIRLLARSRRRIRSLSPALGLLVEWTRDNCEFENRNLDSAE